MNKSDRFRAGEVCQGCGVFVCDVRRHDARCRCDAVKHVRAMRGR